MACWLAMNQEGPGSKGNQSGAGQRPSMTVDLILIKIGS